MALARVDAGLAVGLLDHALRSAARLLNRLEHVTFDSASRRLAMILWMRRDLLFDVRRPLLSRPQLAGTSREMAGRVIRDFEQRGLIARVGATGLVLHDPVGLRAAAGIDEGDVHGAGRWGRTPPGVEPVPRAGRAVRETVPPTPHDRRGWRRRGWGRARERSRRSWRGVR